MNYETSYLGIAHKHCFKNVTEILQSKICGCFCCKEVYAPSVIKEWVDEDDKTAICPKCEIDSVLGDASGLPVSDLLFLKAMNNLFFLNGTKNA